MHSSSTSVTHSLLILSWKVWMDKMTGLISKMFTSNVLSWDDHTHKALNSWRWAPKPRHDSPMKRKREDVIHTFGVPLPSGLPQPFTTPNPTWPTLKQLLAGFSYPISVTSDTLASTEEIASLNFWDVIWAKTFCHKKANAYAVPRSLATCLNLIFCLLWW